MSNLLLRVGVAFAFLYPPIDALFRPNTWIDFFPQFLTRVVPATTLLPLWGVAEVVLALWILSGKKIFIPSSIAVVLLLSIVLLNFSVFDVVFRDLAIAAAAAALALDAWQERYT